MVNGEKRVCRWERADTRVRPYEIIRMEQLIWFMKCAFVLRRGGPMCPPLRIS